MVIEFFGLPGAGKSTLSQRVAWLLAQRRVVVEQPTHCLDHGLSGWHRRLRKSTYAVRQLLLRPLATGRVVRAIAGTEQASSADLATTAFNCVYLSGLLAYLRPRQAVVLLDQGPVQALWSIGFGSTATSWVDALGSFGDLLPAPDLLVWVQASPGTIARRLRARAYPVSRLERRHGAAGASLRRAADGAEEIIACMRQRGVPILHLDTEQAASLAANALRVANTVTARTSTAAGKEGSAPA